MICYQFPPQSGPGVFRSMRFAKNLRNFGIQPVILTIDQQTLAELNTNLDVQLLDGLPRDLEIHRIYFNGDRRLRRYLVRVKLFRIFWILMYKRFWEPEARFSKEAFHKANDLITQFKIEKIYTTSAPFSSLKLAAKLKRECGVKWIADLRDPFTDSFTWNFPSKLHWLIARRWEKKWLKNADLIIVVSEEMKKMLLDRGILESTKIVVIHNGYDD